MNPKPGENYFGGGNPSSLYVPMSPDEMDALERLVTERDMVVRVLEWEEGVDSKEMKAWDVIEGPDASFGDKRLVINLPINFSRPDYYVPVHTMGFELRTTSGFLLMLERKAVSSGSGALMVRAGESVVVVWDISIGRISAEAMRAIRPRSRGATSRVGNMSLDDDGRRLLGVVDEGVRRAAEAERERLEAAIARERRGSGAT